MNPLLLSPLPSSRIEDESGSLLMEREGFVDEDVVAALLSSPLHLRSTGYPEDLALAADEMDFAGWRTVPQSPFRGAEIPPHVVDAIVRRATPPAVVEPGLGSPHVGSHRWWLAGLAGVLSTMLFSVLLLTLSERPGMRFDSLLSPKMLVTAKPQPVLKDKADVPVQELTDASTDSH